MTWFRFSALNVNNVVQMDVLICLQKLLRCYLLLIPTVINKDRESEFKSIPWITGNLPLPQTNLVCHYLTFPSVFSHSIRQSPFTMLEAKRNAAPCCELNPMSFPLR